MKLSSCDGPQICLRVPRVVPNNSLIIGFATRGDVDGMKQILQERLGSPFDCDFDIGSSPLGWAIFYLRLEVCELLLKVGADRYQVDKMHRNAFDHAWNVILTKRGDASARDRLCTLFLSEDYLDKHDFTLLHKTVLGLNNLDLTTLLASVPISTINKGDSLDCTAIWWAATRGDSSSLSLLIKHGADIEKASYRGGRPLDQAILYNRLACAELLIDSGHNVECSDLAGWTPTHNCCYSTASVGIVERLISKGAKIDACALYGETPLHLASQLDNEQLVKCLISHGANLNITDISGESPLYYAIQNNSSQVLQVLLQHHADCSLRTNAGETLLHHAAQCSNIQCLEILRLYDLSCIKFRDRITGTSPSQTLKGVVGLTALEIAKRRTDVTPEWLDVFQKLIHEVEFPENRSSTNLIPEAEDFEDALEHQD